MPNYFCSEKMPTIDVAINLIYCRQVHIWYIFCYIRKAKNTITMAEPRLSYIRPLIEQESFIIEGGFALSDPSSSLTETIPEEDTGFSSDDFWQ